MDASGVDDLGNIYDTAEDFWKIVKRRKANDTSHTQNTASSDQSNTNLGPHWYSAAVDYWDKQEASDNGVLGGFGFVSDADVKCSKEFLLKNFKVLLKRDPVIPPLVALDCGAGVGRVTEQLLLHHFQEVDLVEPSSHLLEEAKKRFHSSSATSVHPPNHKAVNFFLQGLESFDPEPNRYDVIWVQWAMLYLTDDDAVAFLHRCIAALKPHGLIFVKENICNEGFIVDSEDASVTRSHEYYMELFTEKAGLRVVDTALQKGFPRKLFKVRMYAVR